MKMLYDKASYEDCTGELLVGTVLYSESIHIRRIYHVHPDGRGYRARKGKYRDPVIPLVQGVRVPHIPVNSSDWQISGRCVAPNIN